MSKAKTKSRVSKPRKAPRAKTSAGETSLFKKIDRQRLSQQVSDEIEEKIISGTFGIGNRLPAEQALAGQFGVSRNVIREAFKVLQERGLIEIRNGSGAYVSQPDSGVTSDALGRYLRLVGMDSSIKALYEARRTLEGETARLASERANEQDLEVLTACLSRMKQHAGSIDNWTEADLDFHMVVAQATHNPFFGILLKPLVDQMRTVIAEGFLVPGATDTGLEAHTKLYHYIKNRDSEGAYNTLIEHLRDSETRVAAFEERRRREKRSRNP